MPRANARAASRQSVYKNEGVYSATQGYAGFSFVSDGGTPPAYYATNADVAMGVALTSAPWFLVEFVLPLQGDKGQTGDGTRGVYIRSATTPTSTDRHMGRLCFDAHGWLVSNDPYRHRYSLPCRRDPG